MLGAFAMVTAVGGLGGCASGDLPKVDTATCPTDQVQLHVQVEVDAARCGGNPDGHTMLVQLLPEGSADAASSEDGVTSGDVVDFSVAPGRYYITAGARWYLGDTDSGYEIYCGCSGRVDDTAYDCSESPYSLHVVVACNEVYPD
jgi:hypothetical protein